MVKGKFQFLSAGIMLLVVAADQILKHLVRTYMELGESMPAEGGFIRLYYTLNDGVAFSFLRGAGLPLVVIQSVLVLVILAVLVLLIRRGLSVLPLCCLSLMLGGGIGNLIDRILSGRVTDFVAVGRFPIFNFADAALTTGCFLLIFWMLATEFLAHRRRGAESRDEE